MAERMYRARKAQVSRPKPKPEHTSFVAEDGDDNFSDIGIPSANPDNSKSYNQKINTYSSGPQGELSKRSKQVQEAKRRTNYPEGLLGDVFETTAMIVGAKACVKVSHMMIDTGAASIFISMEAATAARLKILECEPKTFRLADGSKSTHDRHTIFELYIAGIHARVRAFIDRGQTGHHILFGKPGIKAFNASANFSCGPRKETRWFLAQDVKGQRRKKILLKEDPRAARTELHVYGHQEGLQLAMQRGETAKERNSREILERHEARGRRLYERHAMPVDENPDWD